MDVVILCGGKGTRLSEETIIKPKPMVEIGGKPILWHIMKTYSYHGYHRFILALGYRSDQIKQYFINSRLSAGDFSIKLDPNHNIEYLNCPDEKDWEIVCINTGNETLKGGRIKRIEEHVKSEQFHLTYGDGLCDVSINQLVKFHNSHDCLGTVTTVRPPSRFGEMVVDKNNIVISLEEKPQMGKGLINGGYFVFSKQLFSYLSSDKNCDFEFGPLQQIAKDGQLRAFKHTGFWQCMDNVRERDYLDNLVRNKKAPWLK